jgi:hypothetical protein
MYAFRMCAIVCLSPAPAAQPGTRPGPAEQAVHGAESRRDAALTHRLSAQGLTERHARPVRVRVERPAGESPVRASRQRSPVVNLRRPAKSAASKRGEANLQAVVRANPAASKELPVRERAGRARMPWAKAEVQAEDSGAAWNRSGVRGSACKEGRSINWGGPPAPGRRVDRGGSSPGYKPRGESPGCAEGVGAGHSTGDRRDNTTRQEGRARTSVTRRLRRDG